MKIVQVTISSKYGEEIDQFFVIDEDVGQTISHLIRAACERKLNCADSIEEAEELIREIQEDQS